MAWFVSAQKSPLAPELPVEPGENCADFAVARDLLSSRARLSHNFPEKTQDANEGQREDDCAHIGDAQPEHDGMDDPQPEIGHAPESRHPAGAVGEMHHEDECSKRPKCFN